VFCAAAATKALNCNSVYHLMSVVNYYNFFVCSSLRERWSAERPDAAKKASAVHCTVRMATASCHFADVNLSIVRLEFAAVVGTSLCLFVVDS